MEAKQEAQLVNQVRWKEGKLGKYGKMRSKDRMGREVTDRVHLRLFKIIDK